jgi:hypothetical protein
MPASAKQRRAAIALVILFATVAAALAPFASVQAPPVDAFVPVIQTVICVADLLTAVLLFSQYTLEPRPAVLALASVRAFVFGRRQRELDMHSFARRFSDALTEIAAALSHLAPRVRDQAQPAQPSKKAPPALGGLAGLRSSL